MDATREPTAGAQPVRLPPGADAEVPGLGRWTGANPAETHPALGDGRTILYSGWLGEQHGAADGVFTPDFATWGPAGREAWSNLLDELAAEAGPSSRVCFRPHARHLLSDPQACLNLLRARGAGSGAGPFEALLEPAAFLTPEMLDAADDHVARAIEALADRPDVPALLLSDCEPVDGELRLVAPGAGVLGAGVLGRVAAAAEAFGKPLYALA